MAKSSSNGKPNRSITDPNECLPSEQKVYFLKNLSLLRQRENAFWKTLSSVSLPNQILSSFIGLWSAIRATCQVKQLEILTLIKNTSSCRTAINRRISCSLNIFKTNNAIKLLNISEPWINRCVWPSDSEQLSYADSLNALQTSRAKLKSSVR